MQRVLGLSLLPGNALQYRVLDSERTTGECDDELKPLRRHNTEYDETAVKFGDESVIGNFFGSCREPSGFWAAQKMQLGLFMYLMAIRLCARVKMIAG